MQKEQVARYESYKKACYLLNCIESVLKNLKAQCEVCPCWDAEIKLCTGSPEEKEFKCKLYTIQNTIGVLEQIRRKFIKYLTEVTEGGEQPCLTE
ncbi:hypothetical protein DRH14_02545 [Candidatus Shapirobacteria bacterium]|nr:MAG: hypothetical protein DRH14_02545 [Candidatus Shapirobacteria bacterium]